MYGSTPIKPPPTVLILGANQRGMPEVYVIGNGLKRLGWSRSQKRRMSPLSMRSLMLSMTTSLRMMSVDLWDSLMSSGVGLPAIELAGNWDDTHALRHNKIVAEQMNFIPISPSQMLIVAIFTTGL